MVVWPFLVAACFIAGVKNQKVALVFLVLLIAVRAVDALGAHAGMFSMTYAIGAVIVILAVDTVAGAVCAAFSISYVG